MSYSKEQVRKTEDHREGSVERKKVTLGKGRLQEKVSPGNGVLRPAGGRAARPSPKHSSTDCRVAPTGPQAQSYNSSPPPAALPPSVLRAAPPTEGALRCHQFTREA